ncbi:hypothetical protein ACLKA6_001697 [Drosophila palustris]
MNDVHLLSPIDDLAEKLPKYCDFFKFLLVEELSLEPDYRQLHYGKCAVVGRLSAIPDYFSLENVTVPHLPSDYKLPTGAVSLLLLNFTYDKANDQSLAHGSYCIVRGEIVLCNVQKANSDVLTTRGLHEHLLLLGDNEVAHSQFLEQIHTTHKPALNVWHTRRIDQAEELIQRQLEIRLFKHTASTNYGVHLEPQWKDQTQQAAWLEFWQREGHELLEQKWHKHYPQYKQEIEEATAAERATWEELWQQHASNQSAHFWHIFTCAFENYENDLSNGLRDVEQTFDNVNEHLADLNIYQGAESSGSCESNAEDEPYFSANDDPDFIDEEQQLRLLGLPTSFGVKLARKQRKPKPQPLSESDSDSDSSFLNMPKDTDKDLTLHSVQWRSIKKKKRQKATRGKIPEFMQNSTMLKYWFKRFSLFSRFDRGILLDHESWFSVTPEKIAKQTALRLASDVVVDAFCGCGGNAIQFANTCGRVIAIDIDANKLAMAKHNAAIYGVAHKIEFIHADFMQFANSTRLRPNVVFLSPPWGGPGYQKQATFDIEQHLLPLGATQLMQHARRLSENVGVFLPRSSNIKQVIALSHVGEQCEVEHNYLDTRLVAITAYYGSLVKSQ